MTVVSSSRYSTGEIATAEAAESFSWEAPVPVNRFWDSFSYGTARSFLGNFSDAELEQLAIDPVVIDSDNTADQQKKLQLLLQLLRNKLANEETAHSRPQSLYDVDYKRWPDESNVVPLHMLAEYFVKAGKYKEAEEIARPVCEWMDACSHLGKTSPQAINTRGIITRALWGQGPSRRSEAEALIANIRELVDGMGESKFCIYQKEEVRLNKEMLADLKLEI
ncbi:hypothetical protein DTO013E5_6465 [Penicillium roqueforti]|uniref:uncharacterized protein n=1 Tax=Penicillium roqueforti TaxID=5082 RepID=UPI001909EF4D|nr:uncharacterized protein LCP9604111_7458 [Penicillium roqueforti]KAF9244024.1 hypothetical protein LCP9604111_7458 [Penicillium roqueforti]KAI2669696.1 hypothetical protein CBS147355_9750 [Penicillium roqueforti]KAI2672806.1 hypothetical protein LCP963914a_9307 [Penicillium roqueforti]KAI2696125.1 hypothetical protein CBS147372_8616 [Penicillium roqueforti]KAI2711518.1 hypothetical protein CBS147354_8214 [Penicillium roqueforti]